MKLTWKTCLRAGITAFLLYLAIHYWGHAERFLSSVFGAAASLLIGAIIAYIVNIPMSVYERHFFPKSQKKIVRKIRRPLCLLASFLSLIAIITAIIWIVVPQLISCTQLILEELPGFFNDMVEKAKTLDLFTPETIGMLENIDWASRVEQIFGMLTSGIGSVAEIAIDVVTSVFSGVVTGFLSLIFAIYLLLSKERLARQYHLLAQRYLKERLRGKIDYVVTILNECFHRYIVGQCTEALILGVLCMLGMWALGLPYPAMVGALVAFTALIPVIGAFVGGAVGAFMIMTVSPVQALVFIIFLVVLQQLEGNIIYPRVVGSSLRLPAIWVLAAVTIGGGIFGVAGMLLGVPVTAAIYRIVREDVQKHCLTENEEEE